MSLFHLTEPSNVENIVQHGLDGGDDRCIFAITDLAVAENVARDQLFVDRYAIIEIDEMGIPESSLCADHVAESTQRFHRIVELRHIPPHLLRHVETRDVSWYPTEWDYSFNELKGWSRQLTDDLFRLTREHLQRVDAGDDAAESANRCGRESRALFP